jgi:hypothetical protein
MNHGVKYAFGEWAALNTARLLRSGAIIQVRCAYSIFHQVLTYLGNLIKPVIAATRTLRDMAKTKTLEEILYCSPEDLPRILDVAGQLPDFLPALKPKIYSESSVLSSSGSAAIMLHTLLRKIPLHGCIDLSPFNLDEDQISYVLFESELTSASFHTLSLSGNKHFRVPLLTRILEI